VRFARPPANWRSSWRGRADWASLDSLGCPPASTTHRRAAPRRSRDCRAVLRSASDISPHRRSDAAERMSFLARRGSLRKMMCDTHPAGSPDPAPASSSNRAWRECGAPHRDRMPASSLPERGAARYRVAPGSRPLCSPFVARTPRAAASLAPARRSPRQGRTLPSRWRSA
jgi:hypothetical protein